MRHRSLYGNAIHTDHFSMQGHIALPVASSGIAALLLEGGCTAHSRFKIPVDEKAKQCNMAMQSSTAHLIREAKLIVWDEAPMTHKGAFEMVDTLLKDIMSAGEGNAWRKNVPFGGKTIVFSGDFRQVLPVVPRGSRAAIVGSSLRRSYLWSTMKVIISQFKMC